MPNNTQPAQAAGALRYTVIGDPIAHSISPTLHNAAFEALGIDAHYDKTQLIDGARLTELLDEMNLAGANVTVPHKEAAYRACDEVRGIARQIGAVNTIVRSGAKLIGYNTDAPGFMRAIREFGEIKSALILGAGGTAKAIAHALKDSGCEVAILNRSEPRIEPFQKQGFAAFTHADFTPRAYDLIINTTSAGLKDSALPCPPELLSELLKDAKQAFEVIYNNQTPFLEACRSQNLTTKDGLEMLIYQAALAFNLFCDEKYDADEVAEVMKKAL
jgi:shikimate dehydrogenase